jgi:hypothetical protein
MPDVGQNMRERILAVSLNGSKVFESYKNPHIYLFSGIMRTIYPSVFTKPQVANELHEVLENFVMVPAKFAKVNIINVF